MLKPGDRIGAWTILSVSPDGGRAICACSCSTTRILAVAALMDGSAAMSCGCQPLSKKRKRAQREGLAEEQRRREWREWKPGR